jgi:hypothetical protein
MQVWLVGLGALLALVTSVDVARCHEYDPAKVTIAKPGFSLFSTPLWRIESGSALVEQASTQSDAEHVAAVAAFYTEECQIGAATSWYHPVTYWKNAVRPLAVPFAEDCRSYDPASLAVTAYEGGWYLKALDPVFPGADEANAALALAQQYRMMCAIGRGAVPQPDADPYFRRDSREAQSDAASKVHLVNDWK